MLALISAALVSTSAAISPAGPGFDCAKASTPDEKLVCAAPELAGLDRRIAVLWSWRAELAAEKELESDRKIQRAWLAQRTSCTAGPRAKAAAAEQVACLRALYQARVVELEKAVGPVPDAILVVHRVRKEGTKTCGELDASWPELKATSLPGAAAFNAHFAEKAPAPDCLDPEDGPAELEPGTYSRSSSLLWKDDRFVTWARSTEEYAAGTAHPNHDTQLVTFDLVAGRAIEPDDVFSPAPELRRKLVALLAKRFRENDQEPEWAEENLPKRTFLPGHWGFTATGAEVHFSPYELASYAAGDFEATFTWKELQPFLRPGAPFPLPKR